MMSYDERVVFHSYMESGAERERKGALDLALSDYELARGIADDAQDEGSASLAQTRIDACKEKLDSLEM